MTVGIYGGSFNPVHAGHVGIARRALSELALDRLYVMPAKVSPFKTEEKPVSGLPEYDRLLLVRAAFNGLERVTVDDRELRRGGVSYAIDTVREIVAENPGAKVFFVIGEDSVEGLPRWKDYETLKGLCEFVAYPRTPESSTEIRARLAADESVDALVPPAVALFLKHGVRYNRDGVDPLKDKVVDGVLGGLVRKGGYCPCRLPKNPEFFCPCEEFRGQLADPDWHGPCHCRLYLKP